MLSADQLDRGSVEDWLLTSCTEIAGVRDAKPLVARHMPFPPRRIFPVLALAARWSAPLAPTSCYPSLPLHLRHRKSQTVNVLKTRSTFTGYFSLRLNFLIGAARAASSGCSLTPFIRA